MIVALKGWNAFSTREDLAGALAKRVADVLRKAVATRGTGFLAVSGGSTPAKFFAALSRQELDWSKVTVTLIDERLVPDTSPRSNAALVRANLLVDIQEAGAPERPLRKRRLSMADFHRLGRAMAARLSQDPVENQRFAAVFAQRNA